MVNVVDLMKLQPKTRASARAWSDNDFDALFTKDNASNLRLSCLPDWTDPIN